MTKGMTRLMSTHLTMPSPISRKQNANTRRAAIDALRNSTYLRHWGVSEDFLHHRLGLDAADPRVRGQDQAVRQSRHRLLLDIVREDEIAPAQGGASGGQAHQCQGAAGACP